jgi:hypothetical protein
LPEFQFPIFGVSISSTYIIILIIRDPINPAYVIVKVTVAPPTFIPIRRTHDSTD